MGSTLGVRHDFDIGPTQSDLRYVKLFTDMPWGIPGTDCIKKKILNGFFLRKGLTVIDLFQGLWSVGARFRR